MQKKWTLAPCISLIIKFCTKIKLVKWHYFYFWNLRRFMQCYNHNFHNLFWSLPTSYKTWSVIISAIFFFALQVRLICTDGTRYTKDIDIVRKCACTKKCYWLTDAANHNSNAQPAEVEAAQPHTAAIGADLRQQTEHYKLTFFVDNSTSKDLDYDEIIMHGSDQGRSSR